jgi:hypothetical protein
MLVLATEKNLEDLIGLTTTESGKVLTRLRFRNIRIKGNSC